MQSVKILLCNKFVYIEINQNCYLIHQQILNYSESNLKLTPLFDVCETISTLLDVAMFGELLFLKYVYRTRHF